MQLESKEVIILKPTPAFLSFLANQLPNVTLPNLGTLDENTTAYTVPSHHTEEALLDTLEIHFLEMFQHEIKRRLGANVLSYVSASFLDFLCCFKFEVHSHLVLLGDAFQENQYLLRVKPKALFLKKMQPEINEPIEEDADLATCMTQVTLSHLTENATVIIKQFNTPNEVNPFIMQYFYPIFKMEMMRVCESREQWPVVNSFDDFNRYFSIDAHTQLIHL